MAKVPPDVEQLVQNSLDFWNGNFSKVDVYSDSARLYAPAIPDDGLHGRDEIEAYCREQRTGFPDLHFTIDDMLASDEIVMAELTTTGTHEGRFNDLPPTGREIITQFMAKLILVDGEIQEHHSYWDSQDFFAQLGLTDE